MSCLRDGTVLKSIRSVTRDCDPGGSGMCCAGMGGSDSGM